MFSGPRDFNLQYLMVFLVILATSLALPALLYLLRRKTLARLDRKGQLITPEIFSFFASLYAFFLGFSIVTLWGNYTSTKSCVAQEASAVLASYRLSLPLDGSEPFRLALTDYTRALIDEEWPTMNDTDSMSERCTDLLRTAWKKFAAMKPRDKGDNAVYTAVGNALSDVSRQRMLREVALTGNLYPPVWVILVFGAGAVFVGLFLTNPEQTKSQVCIEIIVAFLVLSCLYFITDIDTPFSGIITITPDALRDVHATLLTLQGAH